MVFGGLISSTLSPVSQLVCARAPATHASNRTLDTAAANRSCRLNISILSRRSTADRCQPKHTPQPPRIANAPGKNFVIPSRAPSQSNQASHSDVRAQRDRRNLLFPEANPRNPRPARLLPLGSPFPKCANSCVMPGHTLVSPRIISPLGWYGACTHLL